MLKILPSHISNLIAAGEVVQRPSSVVKELMENAIDAGADKVSVLIESSGRSLVQVVDNGSGMGREDAILSFKRHATSKIDKAEDLQSITTYGFRGEALASIAAVAEVTMKTRTATDETGTEVSVKSSEVVSVSETACPKGTSIAVRNIFYNVPARRKFLKSDNTEFSKIAEEFIHIALVNNSISFSLIHNGKKIFDVPSGTNLKQRIRLLVGKKYADDLLNIKNESSLIKISGYIGKPESALKKNESRQLFFINGRYFHSQLMKAAVMKGYDRLLPEDKSPSFFICMEADPSKIDINIHPTKAEIKFEDESMVFEFLRAAVRETIGINSIAPTIDFDTDGSIEIPSMVKTKLEFSESGTFPEAPETGIDPDFNPFSDSMKPDAGFEPEIPGFTGSGNPWRDSTRGTKKESGTWDRPYERLSGMASSDYTMPEDIGLMENSAESIGRNIRKEHGYGGLFGDIPQTQSQLLLIKGKYIITPARSGIMVTDIKRARERILFDDYMAREKSGEIISDRTLHPVTLDMSVITRNLIKDKADDFKRLGFDIRIPENDSQIEVYGAPMIELMSDMNTLAGIIENLAESLSENPEGVIVEMSSSVKEKYAAALAKAGASEGLSKINPTEAQAIIDRLLTCRNPGYSPSGEKTIVLMTTEQISKLF